MRSALDGGHPYRITYMTNLSKLAPVKSFRNAGIAVWSIGRNGINENGDGDDILLNVDG